MGVQATLSTFWETCMQIKKQQLQPDMEYLTASKLGKAYEKDVYCHSAYLTSLQSYLMWNPGLDKSGARIKIARRNTNNLRYADDNTLMAVMKRN